MNDIVPTNDAGTDPVVALLNRAALDPNFDAAKFEVAVAFLRERETTAARREFNRAMSAAQAEMRAVPRDRANDHLRSRYATLDGMLTIVLPACTRHGLSVRFTSAPASQPGWLAVSCIISLGDHVEVTTLEGPVMTSGAAGGRTQMTGIQSVGSTVTYLKRYLLGMCFSLVLSDEQDDDGEAGRAEADRRTRHWTSREGAPGTTPPPAARPPAFDAAPPVRPMTKPTQTIAAWLDAFELELAAIEGDEELDATLARDDARRAQEMFTGVAKQRLDDMIQAALARSRARETTAPADGPEGGEEM